jgi:hypothetical protein
MEYSRKGPGHDVKTQRELAVGEVDAASRSRLAMHNLKRAQFALQNSPEQELYQADPAAYLQRFGLRPCSEPGHVHSADCGSAGPAQVKPSSIHGDGLFANRTIAKGDAITPLLNHQRSDVSALASKVNQSENANSVPQVEGGTMVLRAARDMKPGEEILAQYDYPGKR